MTGFDGKQKLMEIRNKPLHRLGLAILAFSILLIIADSGWGLFAGTGMWGTVIPLLLIAAGAYMLDRATDGQCWNGS